MYISQMQSFVFFHNPKTAGRSMIQALGFVEEASSGLYHLRPDEARRRIFQNTWDGYYTFAFVRNPWDRMVSLYEYQRSVAYASFAGFNGSHQLARSYSFEEWLMLNEQGSRRSNWYGIPQSEWQTGLKRTFRFEDVGSALIEIAESVGLPSLAHVHINSSERGPYRAYYGSQRSIDIVARIDSDVISEFDYSF